VPGRETRNEAQSAEEAHVERAWPPDVCPYLEDLAPIRFAALLAKEIGGFVPPDGL
jgi:hypothetical protein